MHRMAKTFDNISDASTTNYLFLFAQRTLALQNEPPTPPPLNALGLPCEAICLLWAWLYPDAPTEASKEAAAEVAAAAVEETVAHRGSLKTFAENIAPLAKAITEYIIDHQDDAAQGEHWRTTMKRDIAKNFRLQREDAHKIEAEVKRQREETESMQKKFQDAQSKMDEKLDRIVKSFT